ncbi:MAG: radical SAM protein [Planctomycetota bacterium]
MRHGYDYLFGPVPSRRLGRSLGVDLTPFKTCSFDCVFCQLGRTTNKTLARQEYVPTSAVIQELHDWIESEGNADVMTLSGSGEPTLHASFGKVIDAIRSSTSVPVAVLTNGSMLGDKAVREAAGRANIVKVSLSAWDQLSFQRINRPHPGLHLQDIVDGARAWRETLTGELWIEVFIVSGMNDDEKEAGKIAELVKSIQADRVQLNTAVRPPAEDFVRAVPAEELARLAEFFDPIAEVTAEFSSEQSPGIQANENTILEMLERRPCTAEQIAGVFGMHGNEVSKYLGKLTRTGRIRAQREGDDTYYVTRTERGQQAHR